MKEELGVDLLESKFFRAYPYESVTGELNLNLFIGKIDDKIQLKQDEIGDYGWFSLDDVINMKDQLRESIIIQQIRDVIEED